MVVVLQCRASARCAAATARRCRRRQGARAAADAGPRLRRATRPGHVHGVRRTPGASRPIAPTSSGVPMRRPSGPNATAGAGSSARLTTPRMSSSGGRPPSAGIAGRRSSRSTKACGTRLAASARTWRGADRPHRLGPQYTAHAFGAELRWLGIQHSPSFVGEPQCNGVIERFMRTLKEQCRGLDRFAVNLAHAEREIAAFIERYNEEWLVQRRTAIAHRGRSE